MDPSDQPRPPGSPRHRRSVRVALSLFFLLHLGAIAVYHLPAGPPDVPGLPAPLSEAAGAALSPVKGAAWPVARRYMDATATRQRWTLFAPWPASWTVSLDAVAYYPVLEPLEPPEPLEPMEPLEPGAGPADGSVSGAPADSLRWTADTVRIEGPEEAPYPHWTDHRAHRIVYNMGYEDWGRYYRPIFARWLCRTLSGPEPGPERAELPPDGITLTALWRELVPPWEEREGSTYEQFLGGYTCADLLGAPLPPHLEGRFAPSGSREAREAPDSARGGQEP